MRKYYIPLLFLIPFIGFAQVTIDQVTFKFDSVGRDSATIHYTSRFSKVHIIRSLIATQNGCRTHISDLEFRGTPDSIVRMNDTTIGIGLSGFITDFFQLRATWDTNPPNTSNTRIFMDTYTYDSCTVTSLVENTINNQYVVHPNPANDYFFIGSDAVVADFIEQVEVFAINGQKVANYSGWSNNYSLAYLPEGVYLVRIITEKTEQTQKIVISR